MGSHEVVLMGSHEEIITDILSRLPVKSLLRFKCVSKFWNTSISDPYFKKKHLNIHAKSPKLLIGQSYSDCYFYLYSSSLLPSSKLVKDIRKLDYPSSFKPTHCRVYCCCDGLALIGIWSTMNQAEITPRLFLWNPSTGESILLPGHLEIPPQDEYIYGLGYDATSDDYKILRVDVYDEIPDEILALKSGSWRKIEGRRSIPMISLRELCLAFVHGAFHWLGTFPRRNCLVSLNISNELYEEISLPKILLSTTSFIVQVGVSVLGGKLSIYNNHDDDFCIWVLEDYGVKESWTKWFTLPNFNKVVLGLYIIPIYRFSDDEVLLSYLNVGGIKYRTSNRSLAVSNRMSPLHCDDTDIEGIQDGLVYTESLISPKKLIV